MFGILGPRYSRRELRETISAIQNSDEGVLEGYPALDRRLLISRIEFWRRVVRGLFHDKTFVIPAGFDAISPYRPSDAQLADRHYPTGDSNHLDPAFTKGFRLRLRGPWRDQHGRLLHPYFPQLIRKVGMPTGLGVFFREGPNNTDDAVVLREHRGQIQVLLVLRQPKDKTKPSRWALPGGFRDPGDSNKTDQPAVVAARRETSEETCLKLDNISGVVVAQTHQVGPQATLTSYTESTAAAFVVTGELIGAKLTPQAGEVLQAKWVNVNDVLQGHAWRREKELEPWPQHIQFLKVALKHRSVREQLHIPRFRALARSKRTISL